MTFTRQVVDHVIRLKAVVSFIRFLKGYQTLTLDGGDSGSVADDTDPFASRLMTFEVSLESILEFFDHPP